MLATWSPDVPVNKMLFANNWLWCATNQPQLLLLNKKGEILRKIEGHEGKVTQLLHLPTRGLVCSGSFDSKCFLLQIASHTRTCQWSKATAI